MEYLHTSSPYRGETDRERWTWEQHRTLSFFLSSSELSDENIFSLFVIEKDNEESEWQFHHGFDHDHSYFFVVVLCLCVEVEPRYLLMNLAHLAHHQQHGMVSPSMWFWKEREDDTDALMSGSSPFAVVVEDLGLPATQSETWILLDDRLLLMDSGLFVYFSIDLDWRVGTWLKYGGWRWEGRSAKRKRLLGCGLLPLLHSRIYHVALRDPVACAQEIYEDVTNLFRNIHS